MLFAYTIKYKTEMGIATKIQSTPGPKHDQINTALIAHHLEVGMKWTLAESSVQFSLSSYVIVGWSNHPFYEWAVLGQMEKITQFMTCPVIIVLHTEEGRRAEASGFWHWILMAINQRCTDEEPLGLDMLVKNFFKCHAEDEYMDIHFIVAMEGWRYSHFLFSIFSPLPSLTRSPFAFQAVLQTSNSIPQQLNRQQLHQANSIENTAQQRLLNRLEQPL